MLRYSDFMAWCGTRLVVAAGFDRYATRGKRLVAAAPPAWRPRPLVGGRRTSWISPACSSDGVTVAAAAGRNFEEPRFGQEHRSIWRLGSGGANPRRLTRPPVSVTDEQPRWARDGRSILFVRTHDSFGRLYLVRLNGSLVGPITDLGTTGNYYGHYGWADQTDWYQPR
jgi:hypothetical protein